MSVKVQAYLPDACKEPFEQWVKLLGSRSAAAQDLILRGMEAVDIWPPKPTSPQPPTKQQSQQKQPSAAMDSTSSAAPSLTQGMNT